MVIQKKFETADGTELWLNENVTPDQLYDLIDECASVRLCKCEGCIYYGGIVCMKHPSVCLI